MSVELAPNDHASSGFSDYGRASGTAAGTGQQRLVHRRRHHSGDRAGVAE